MIGKEHIELDGELYLLAQDAEGSHYDLAGEPLRPPNAVAVQGTDQGEYQVRPDLLLWKITDWSGGEGQIKFDPKAPGRHFELQNVDVFDEPGKLKPGPAVELTTYTSGAGGATFNKSGPLVRARDGLYCVGTGSADIYKWADGERAWGAAINNGSASGGAAAGGVHGDGAALYYIEDGAQKVWKYTGSFSTIESGTISAVASHIAGLGSSVYVLDWTDGSVWEILKSGGGTTLIDDPGYDNDYTGTVTPFPAALIVPGDNKLYTINVSCGDTYIREITPSSAAGEGYGAQIAHLNGFEALTGWWHNGTLYLAGSNYHGGHENIILYLRPGETFGAIGRVRPGQLNAYPSSAEGNGAMLLHALAYSKNPAATDGSSWYTGLRVVDAVTGGMAVLCSSSSASYDDVPLGPVEYQGQWLWSAYSGTARVFTSGLSIYAPYGFATSPIHDFDLAEQKVLSSIRVVTEDALPTDWEVIVKYGLDTDTPDTTAVTMTDTDGKSLSAAISSSASPVVFYHLSIKIELNYTGGGTPSTRPKVLQVEVRAQLAQTPRRWKYLIDCNDRHSGASSSGGNGAAKIAALKTSIAKSVVSLKDGYYDRARNIYSTHDVVVDKYQFVLTRPGEGICYIELVEVL